MRPLPILTVPLISALILAACSPADTGNESNEAAPIAADDAADVAEPTPVATPANGPANGPDLARTAWRAIAADGAVYTTYLDEGGLYRDFRNGDPWRDGHWSRNDEGRLCFTPTDENLAGDCWKLKKPNNNGVMRATNNANLSIRLQQVTYIAPDDETSEGDPQT